MVRAHLLLSPVIRVWVGLPFLVLCLGGTVPGPRLVEPSGDSLPAQDPAGEGQPAPEEEQAQKITKYLDLAVNGRVAVRPQAARRLVQMGDPARVRVLEACGTGGEHLADLGPYLVEALAEFEDSTLRGFLWQSLADLDFPWRGPAARSLALGPDPRELERFLQLCTDRLDQVRLAAVESLDRFDPAILRAQAPQMRELLVHLVHLDDSDRVRRAAALRLDLDGEHGYLLWLVEDLQRTDTYFRLPLGEQARFAAIRALRERLGDDYGFRAEDPPTSEGNAQALKQIQAAVRTRIQGDVLEVPDALRAATDTGGDRIGLELRSCRVGAYFLRWNANDTLYVGPGKGLAIPLEPGTVSALYKSIYALVPPPGETRFWGEVGCDLEQLRLVNLEGAIDAFLISKGQAKVEDLRPPALDQVVRLLVASIPKGEQADLALEVTRALELLGGEF